MLIKLCACNYCTNDGLVDGVEGFLKTPIESHLTSKIGVKFFEPKNWTMHKDDQQDLIWKLSHHSK